MFVSVDEMVEENDRRHLDDSLEPEDAEEPTLQYAIYLYPMTHPTPQSWSSQARVHRGYELLVRLIPALKTKLVNQDIPELNSYFRDVGHPPPYNEYAKRLYSSGRELVAVEETMLPT
jgi:hypothetical protein